MAGYGDLDFCRRDAAVQFALPRRLLRHGFFLGRLSQTAHGGLRLDARFDQGFFIFGLRGFGLRVRGGGGFEGFF